MMQIKLNECVRSNRYGTGIKVETYHREIEGSGNNGPYKVSFADSSLGDGLQLATSADLREIGRALIDFANSQEADAPSQERTASGFSTLRTENEAPDVSRRYLQQPQARKIVKHLKNHGSITRVEAEAVYRCRHIPTVIFHMRECGYKVRSDVRYDATGQRYTRYVLED